LIRCDNDGAAAAAIKHLCCQVTVFPSPIWASLSRSGDPPRLNCNL
jgi:hypothetical protein